MGGFHVFEWPLCTNRGYVRCIVPLCTSAFAPAWGLAWNVLMQDCIQSDPNFNDGYYTGDAQPKAGLAAAQMCAVLSYKSSESFERQFARKLQPAAGKKRAKKDQLTPVTTPPSSPGLNHSPEDSSKLPMVPSDRTSLTGIPARSLTPKPTGTSTLNRDEPEMIFSAQAYLRYQAQKLVAYFDANCFMHNSYKACTHDISRDRLPASTLESVLSSLPPTLLVSISSDGLFPPCGGAFLAKHIPEAEHVLMDSLEGHLGLLVESARFNIVIEEFLRKRVPHVYEKDLDRRGFTSKL